MNAASSRCLFLVGIGVLLGAFFSPGYYVESTLAGQTEMTVRQSTTGLGFSPWFERTERHEASLKNDGAAVIHEGKGRVIWASWSWLLLALAFAWFWIRDVRLQPVTGSETSK